MQAHGDPTGRKPCFTLRVYRDALSERPAELPLGGPAVRLDITDNGPGMPENIRRRVFEPFFTTKPVGVGTGLGLSVSYFIITENHGGKMSVSSMPGEGTTFTIILPIERGPA
jgi:signal transduction histidine kinase